MSEKTDSIDARALALAEKLVAHRKDDTQGFSVKVQSGDQVVELTITAKPSSGGGWRGGAGQAGADQAHTVAEVEAAAKAGGMKVPQDAQVWEEEGKVWAKWPYEQKDNPAMVALGMKWDAAKKARWSPLKGAAAPSQ